MPVDLDQNDPEADEGSFVNIAVNQQDGVHVQDDGRCGRYGGEQQPVVRSKRNSKYDPAVYDLDAVERRIPMSGKKNGYGGVYWPY